MHGCRSNNILNSITLLYHIIVRRREVKLYILHGIFNMSYQNYVNYWFVLDHECDMSIRNQNRIIYYIIIYYISIIQYIIALELRLVWGPSMPLIVFAFTEAFVMWALMEFKAWPFFVWDRNKAHGLNCLGHRCQNLKAFITRLSINLCACMVRWWLCDDSVMRFGLRWACFWDQKVYQYLRSSTKLFHNMNLIYELQNMRWTFCWPFWPLQELPFPSCLLHASLLFPPSLSPSVPTCLSVPGSIPFFLDPCPSCHSSSFPCCPSYYPFPFSSFSCRPDVH